MQSHSDINVYLDNIRRLIDDEINVYNEYQKGSVTQRLKNYFDLLKSPTLNLPREYAPYKEILDNKKLSNQEKLDALIKMANEIITSIEETKQRIRANKIEVSGKWKYGGQLHNAIAYINKDVPYDKEQELHSIRHNLDETVGASQPRPKPRSAPSRIESGNDINQPVVRLSRSSSTLYSQPAQAKESNEDKCVGLLLQIFALTFEKKDLTEKEINEYDRCNYVGILKDQNVSSKQKIGLLFNAAKPILTGSLKGRLHQLVFDINPTTDYIERLRYVCGQLQQSAGQKPAY